MSKNKRLEGGMIPSAEAGERFMALLLWAQSRTCSCPACEYFREMADKLVTQHVPEVKASGKG